jgi:hypothetical protein
MSEFFKNKNTKEFGPAPIKETLYLVIEDPTVTGNTGETRFAFVFARSGFGARDQARVLIPDFKDTAFLCFPNPVRYNGD